MKKYLLLLSVVIVGLSACKKVDFAAEQATIDEAKIQAYIAANPSTTGGLTKDASGIYYKIEKPGDGDTPTATSKVKINYTGKLLNGSVFESRSGYTSTLSSFIQGFQTGLLKIKGGTINAGSEVPGTGGKIMLIIPSSLAYGANSTGNIPANSVIIFNVELIGVGA